jgi:hypothetical protein
MDKTLILGLLETIRILVASRYPNLFIFKKKKMEKNGKNKIKKQKLVDIGCPPMKCESH